ncbi:MAG: PqqD family peptide modification chaperone [Candidatus Cloacimonetes bacterium]|nr:PqqD family peptide modification chaperone [Candidatus Cloacimonadota bacterium]
MIDNSRVKLIQKLEVTDLDGEKVMIDFSSGKYFLLKGAANEIWDYIQDPIAVSDILQRLMNVYEVSEETCRESTYSFLNQLKNYAFITIE